MISDSAMLSELAAEFPGYEFSTQRTWEGVSLIAVRQDGSDRPGLCVVITPDRDEMRRALLESMGLETKGLECERPGDENPRLYGVDVPVMQLEQHGWDIHAVSTGRTGRRTGITGHRNVPGTQENQGVADGQGASRS